jgi:molybdenum cofactor cytidylyltransferase
VTDVRPEATDVGGEPDAVAGLVLAAGAGTRFGESSKLLAELHGRPLLEWAVRAQCGVRAISRVVVVLGARADEVLARVDFGRAETVVCEDWETGQAASLRTGLTALNGAAKVLVTLGDQPLITPAVVARFVGEPPLTRAVYDGRPGHPVVLGAEQISELMSLRGDRGARDLLRGGPVIEAGRLCSGRDVDTPDDLEAVRDEARTVI